MPSTQYAELSHEGPQEVTTTQPFDAPRRGPSAPRPPRQEEPNEDIHEGVFFPHLDQNCQPPPSRLPPQKRISIFGRLFSMIKPSRKTKASAILGSRPGGNRKRRYGSSLSRRLAQPPKPTSFHLAEAVGQLKTLSIGSTGSIQHLIFRRKAKVDPKG
jgi:hypothetical protein